MSTLVNYPDKDLVQLVLQGISQGFRIGFDYGTKKVQRCAHGNMSSVLDNLSVVDSYLQEELSLGRAAGPFDTRACKMGPHQMGPNES